MVGRSWSTLLAALGVAQSAGLRHTDPKSDEYGLVCMSFDKDNMQERVTAIVSTSARAEDASGRSLEVLKQTVRSIRGVLGLQRAEIVVAWDALPGGDSCEGNGARDLPESAEAHYARKLRDFEEWNRKELRSQVTIFRNAEWTHQTEMLRRVFEFLAERKRMTPLLYLAQDDSPVVGDIDVPFILEKLACDPTVDYVRFLWANDCTEGKAPNWNYPCRQHAQTNRLHKVLAMSDRPHFATAHFYMHQVFRRAPRSYRGAPERLFLGIRHGWLYGERHHMLHDRNELQNSYMWRYRE